MSPTGIDWSRMAEPQEDQYDTGVVLERVTTTTTAWRSERYVRLAASLAAAVPRTFDGAVAVHYLSDPCPRAPVCVNAPPDHPHIAQAAEYVRRWPAVFRQFQLLMDSFHPLTDTSIPESRRARTLGSSSQSEQQRFGAMYGTVDHPLGLAQAFVHEMAHNKLFGLGLYLESTDTLITNPPEALYESPIRKDQRRPMTAVFHAQYSFMHVTQLDIRMFEGETDPGTRRDILFLLRHNLSRMQEGDAELRRHIRVDDDGRRFLGGFLAWSERVLSRGAALLQDHRDLLPA